MKSLPVRVTVPQLPPFQNEFRLPDELNQATWLLVTVWEWHGWEPVYRHT